ncbi:unnamed protein product [Angiostrongylus costaricensis]|uniref:DUF3707 domain-containing protein n=1 Tax=Angiostrongylus costaricensis TaxID=334426 RepID=A0A0R3PB85_ANGCS|nr:unnamed protein product [Angiostrongylus costaricensis]
MLVRALWEFCPKTCLRFKWQHTFNRALIGLQAGECGFFGVPFGCMTSSREKHCDRYLMTSRDVYGGYDAAFGSCSANGEKRESLAVSSLLLLAVSDLLS